MAVITITLQKIRDAQPCEAGWKTLLKAQGGTGADYSAEFPLSDVLDSNGLHETLWCLRCLPEHDNLWRLYAVWCARQVQHLMTDQRSIDALDVAERHARGLATDAELAAALGAAEAAWDAAWAAAEPDAAWAAARAAAWVAAETAAAARGAWAAARGEWAAARAAQEQKLREILTRGKW